jgi:predicted phosphoribosyltransferase
LDILLVRKLGVPGREELAFGAIASGGHRVLNHDIVAQLRISPRTIEEITRAERQELERRERAYRGQRDPIAVKGRTVILIDDGMATGASMLVAVEALREQSPERLIVALPVAPASARELLLCYPCEVIVHATPEPFVSVGAWYADFSQTTDEEVRTLLAAFR